MSDEKRENAVPALAVTGSLLEGTITRWVGMAPGTDFLTILDRFAVPLTSVDILRFNLRQKSIFFEIHASPAGFHEIHASPAGFQRTDYEPVPSFKAVIEYAEEHRYLFLCHLTHLLSELRTVVRPRLPVIEFLCLFKGTEYSFERWARTPPDGLLSKELEKWITRVKEDPDLDGRLGRYAFSVIPCDRSMTERGSVGPKGAVLDKLELACAAGLIPGQGSAFLREVFPDLTNMGCSEEFIDRFAPNWRDHLVNLKQEEKGGE